MSIYAPVACTTAGDRPSRRSLLRRRFAARREHADDDDDDDNDTAASTSSGVELGTLLPTQTTDDKTRALARASVASSSCSSLPPPTYDALYGAPSGDPTPVPAAWAFSPTVQLHIDTVGRPLCAGPFAPPADPIAVYAAAAADDGSPVLRQRPQPAFVSLRQTRGSGTCALVAGADAEYVLAGGGGGGGGAAAGVLRTLSTTTYRFGPGRPPRVDLFPDGAGAAAAPWDAFAVRSTSLVSRAQTMRTRLGELEWRYASRAERAAVAREMGDQVANNDSDGDDGDLSSLLVLDRVVRVFGAVNTPHTPASLGGPRAARRPVARLLRSAALRTPGSTRSAAGNGGRLQIDLGAWLDDDGRTGQDGEDGEDGEDGAGPAAARAMAISLAVTTALCMLKKEVDRRRAQKMGILAVMVA